MDKMTTCRTCGETIAKSANSCLNYRTKQKKRHPILGIILAVFGIGLIGAAINGGGNEPEKVGDVDTPKQTQEEQKNEFCVGDVVSLNDIEVTFVSCTESNGKQYLEPEEGNVFLICEFSIDNKSEKDIAVSSLVSFEAYVDDYSTTLSLTGTVSTDKQQLDGSIAAGKKMNGVVGYEVPKDWKELEIRFTPDFWTGKDITFIATN